MEACKHNHVNMMMKYRQPESQRQAKTNSSLRGNNGKSGGHCSFRDEREEERRMEGWKKGLLSDTVVVSKGRCPGATVGPLLRDGAGCRLQTEPSHLGQKIHP